MVADFHLSGNSCLINVALKIIASLPGSCRNTSLKIADLIFLMEEDFLTLIVFITLITSSIENNSKVISFGLSSIESGREIVAKS